MINGVLTDATLPVVTSRTCVWFASRSASALNAIDLNKSKRREQRRSSPNLETTADLTHQLLAQC